MRKVVFAAGVLLAFVGFPQTSDFFVPASTARAPSVPAPPPRLRGRAAAEGAWGASGSAAPPSAEKPAAALLVCAAGLAALGGCARRRLAHRPPRLALCAVGGDAVVSNALEDLQSSVSGQGDEKGLLEFEVTVPAGAAAGATMDVETPDGQAVTVEVPAGLGPGAVFRVAYEPAAPVVPTNYDEAEQRGLELAKAGNHERAIRMFELAQTLPGAGVDFKREKQGGGIGGSGAAPNPREWGEQRYATQEQKLIAQYNIACCCAAMGDKTRAMEILRAYLGQVTKPLQQANEMLVDEDLLPLREELRALREEFKAESEKPGLFGIRGLKNPLREIADIAGVEWKD